jgi:hypothetical protein
LPAGYRPKAGTDELFSVLCATGCPPGSQTSGLYVHGAGVVKGHDGGLQIYSSGTQVSLDGVTFRAGGYAARLTE